MNIFAKKKKQLRLPLPPREDPVLDENELELVRGLLEAHIAWAEDVMSNRPVSEAIIRKEIYARSALNKIQEVLDRG